MCLLESFGIFGEDLKIGLNSDALHACTVSKCMHAELMHEINPSHYIVKRLYPMGLVEVINLRYYHSYQPP